MNQVDTVQTAVDTAASMKSIWDNGWIQEIFGGIFTSIAFLFLMRIMRPRIQISDKICKNERGEHILKVVNKSWWKAIEVKFSLQEVTPFNGPDGENVYLKVLKLNFNHIDVFHCKLTKGANKNKTYAGQIRIDEDLDVLWPVGSAARLEFNVIAKHSLSGFQKVFTKTYLMKSTSVKCGEFKTGGSLEIES